MTKYLFSREIHQLCHHVENKPLEIDEVKPGRRQPMSKQEKKVNVNLRLFHYIMGIDAGGRGMSQGMSNFLKIAAKIRRDKNVSLLLIVDICSLLAAFLICALQSYFHYFPSSHRCSLACWTTQIPCTGHSFQLRMKV